MAGHEIIGCARRARKRPRFRVLATVAVVALVATALGSPSASAATPGLTTGISDNSIFDPSAHPSAKRELWLDRAKNARAGLIRITVDWRNMVRRKPKRPADPKDPAYGFVRLDQAIRDAEMSGFQVMLTVYRAPSWAEGRNPPKGIEPGAWKPDPVQYGKFGQALARRYRGDFQGLPRVRYFEAWTEPNLTQFLAPQWEGKSTFAPERYRQLLNHFYAGVHQSQPGATVIGGATSPFGDSRKHQVFDSPRMRPIVFLRTALCLNAKLKRSKNCAGQADLDAVSAHPINTFNGPRYTPRNKNDVQVANFRRVGKVVRRAKRAKTIRPTGSTPLWVTEMGFVSDPPNPRGAPLKKHARWVEEGLYLLWKQGARVVVNLNIRDPGYDRSRVPRAQWTTGLYFTRGVPKPALKAFRFPFVTERKSKKRIQAWGKAPASGKLKIQAKKRGGKWRTKKKFRVSAGQVFQRKIRLRGKAKLRAKVGKAKSLPWRQGK